MAGIAFDELARALDGQHDDLAAALREFADDGTVTAVTQNPQAASGYYHAAAPEPYAAQIEQEQASIDGKLKGIHSLEHRLANTDPDRARAYLIGFSTEGDGRAIVSIGNPDTARNVLTYVPGTTTDLGNCMKDVNRTTTMTEDANAADASAPTATIMWLGYDAPNEIPDAASGDYADRAVADLNRFQTGLRVTHDEPTPSHNVVLGHSYGTTVIGHTATQAGINADDLISVASPGVGVDHASDLHGADPEQVWSTRADGDLTGGCGEDPAMHPTITLAQAMDQVERLLREAETQLPAGSELKKSRAEDPIACEDANGNGIGQVSAERWYTIEHPDPWPTSQLIDIFDRYWQGRGYRITRDDRGDKVISTL